MSRPNERARAAVRAVEVRALLLIAALLVGKVATFVHQAAVTHARCAEHGELVHGEETAAAGGLAGWYQAMRHQAADLGADPADELRGLAAGDDHDHDHCWATSAARIRTAQGDRSGALAAPPEAAAAVGADRIQLTCGALYRTAPKTSPPIPLA
jgi:hypothetical protein